MHRQSKIYSTEDARLLAKAKLPRMVFDFVEGGAGREIGLSRNEKRFNEILLQPRAMKDVTNRVMSTRLLGQEFNLPVGIAPMGLCNLVNASSDRGIAELAREWNVPIGLSSAGSTSLEDMQKWAGPNAWFQLYFGESKRSTLRTVERALAAGYDTLILTVDVPVLSRRTRDLRNGFNLPFQMTASAFFDFATHPRWSMSTLFNGIPAPKNHSSESGSFDRKASRAGANWEFLQELRDVWNGRLIVKGVTSTDDAVAAQGIGVDAIYVSNHGARQLDSVPAAIDLLPHIRKAVGPAFPLLFDSGIRNGEDVVKALALGADFAMIGRPALYALAAEGTRGLTALFENFESEIDTAMAQLGICCLDEIGANVLYDEVGHQQHNQKKLRSISGTAQSASMLERREP